jgi:hypothetical protein
MLVIQPATRRYAPTLLLAAGLAIGLPHASRADTPAPAPPRVNVFPGPLIVRANTYGNFDTACVAGVIGNEGDSGRCQVEGYDPSVAGYSHYDSVDSVGLFVSNSSKPPTLTLPGASFPTPTRIAVSPPLTPQDLARLRPGMHVAAGTAPPFRSEIASWDGGGHFIDLIGGWGRAGHAEPGQIPPGGVPVFINKIERVWALNANVLLLPGGAQSGVGFELGMVNANRAPPETTWGYDSINLGCGSQPVEHPECMAGSAFIARGNWQVAYRAQSGRVAAFMVDQTGKTGNGIGLLSEAPLQPQASDQPSFDFLQYNPAGRGPAFGSPRPGAWWRGASLSPHPRQPAGAKAPRSSSTASRRKA